MGGPKGSKSARNLFFAFVDGLLILSSVFIGTAFKISEDGLGLRWFEQIAGKTMLVVLLVQISFYYFDLYEFRSFRERIKMTMAMMEAIGVSIILLAIIYYFLPFLEIGQGISILTLVLVFSTTLTWRLFSSSLIRNIIPKDRILIIGSGKLAQKTVREILENGQDIFEIIGCVDERSKRPG